jgi:pimeloyl-ACP methyl ester carboxylesterase
MGNAPGRVKIVTPAASVELPMAITEEKPLALLIPGLDGTGLLYFKQVVPLSMRYRVRPWVFRVGWNFDYEDLVAELGRGTSQELRGSIVVIGESFGGTVAMHYVLRYPERVQKLVLINTFPRYPRRTRIWLACRLVRLLQFRGARWVKEVIVDRTLAVEGIEEGDRRRYQEIVRKVDPEAYRRRLRLVRQVDLRGQLSQISVPTMILASGRDKLVPSISEARGMASLIPDARVYEFPRAGHGLLLTPGFSLADYV